MKKTRNKSQIMIILLFLLPFMSVCHKAGDIKRIMKDNQGTSCKFDASRIVNKVLDSTNIDRLYGFGKEGRFAIYKNDFIDKYDIQIKSKKYYLSEDCDSLDYSAKARMGECWFLEFIQFDSLSEHIYRLHFAVPFKSRGGFYDFNINDYTIVDSFKVKYKAESDTIRYKIFKGKVL
jgi:hypothetical protein